MAIWKDAIHAAIKKLDAKSWPSKNNSTNYDFVYDGKGYPPKEVYRIAAEIFESKNPNEHAPNLVGGTPTNEFLQRFGFEIQQKKTALKTHHTKEFFNEHEFDLLEETAGKPCDRSFPDVENAYQDLKLAYSKVKYWAEEIRKTIFPEGVVKINQKPTNQANKFDGYLWAKIYPNKQTLKAKWLAYTVGVSTNNEYHVKIDTVGQNNTPLRRKYEEFRGDFNKSNIVFRHSFGDFGNWKNLLEQSISDINKLKDIFPRVQELGALKEFNFSSSPTLKNQDMPNLNQILYGPPGTGKTYKTKELAIQITNPSFIINNRLSAIEKRAAISEEYNRLCKNGQIVFTTFHQSFSYEDFVEGIKPETLDNNVTYSVVPGIFKEICEKADTKDASNFEEILARFKEDVIEEDKITVNTGSIEFDVFYKGGKTFKINPKDSKVENPQYPASIENILKLYKNAPNENMYNPSYVKGILNFLFTKYGLKKYDTIGPQNNKKYVLIIDEINRGNVSAIFGELITLLEPDKRLGADEEIVLNLPYSKDETFGVPPNLYIIGTMNTADRSVEALDTALRRRFVFEEVMPQPELLKEIEFENFNLKQVLEAINERIGVLLDRDHTIGHSYFIKLNSGDVKGLSDVFKNNIIPLLQEYFYHDYEKIALVLGRGFVQEKVAKKNIFPKFANIEEPETDNIYELITSIENIEAAVDLLLDTSNE